MEGEIAVDWLAMAQLFAGPPSDPPPRRLRLEAAEFGGRFSANATIDSLKSPVVVVMIWVRFDVDGMTQRRRVDRLPHRLFGHPDAEWSVFANRPSGHHRPFDLGAVGDHVGDQPDPVGFVGIEDPAGEQEFGRRLAPTSRGRK